MIEMNNELHNGTFSDFWRKMLQIPSLLSEIDVLEKTFIIENIYI